MLMLRHLRVAPSEKREKEKPLRLCKKSFFARSKSVDLAIKRKRESRFLAPTLWLRSERKREDEAKKALFRPERA